MMSAQQTNVLPEKASRNSTFIPQTLYRIILGHHIMFKFLWLCNHHSINGTYRPMYSYYIINEDYIHIWSVVATEEKVLLDVVCKHVNVHSGIQEIYSHAFKNWRAHSELCIPKLTLSQSGISWNII